MLIYKNGYAKFWIKYLAQIILQCYAIFEVKLYRFLYGKKIIAVLKKQCNLFYQKKKQLRRDSVIRTNQTLIKLPLKYILSNKKRIIEIGRSNTYCEVKTYLIFS